MGWVAWRTLLVTAAALLSALLFVAPDRRWSAPQLTTAFRETPLAMPPSRGFSAAENQLDRVATALRRLAPPARARWWAEDIHALRLWGVNQLKSPHDWPGDQVLERLLDSKLMERQYPGVLFHRLTQHGVEIHTADPATKVNGDPHPDKSLSVLAMLGVPTTRRMAVGASDCTIADLLRGSIANFRLSRELPWTAIAYALYLPPGQNWSNKHGASFNFDQFCTRLCQTPIGEGSCYGAHVPFALAVIVASDSREPLLTAPVKRDAIRYLTECASRLRSNELDGGGWDGSWSFDPATGSRLRRHGAQLARVNVTGHSLEWLAISPSSLRGVEPMMERAAGWLVEEILEAPSARLQEEYSTYSHAAAALKQLFPEAWRRALRDCAQPPNSRLDRETVSYAVGDGAAAD